MRWLKIDKTVRYLQTQQIVIQVSSSLYKKNTD